MWSAGYADSIVPFQRRASADRRNENDEDLHLHYVSDHFFGDYILDLTFVSSFYILDNMTRDTKKRTKAPGKAHREGITLLELADMFPNEESAVKWFEDAAWGEERCCGHCGSTNTYATKNRKPMPYRCRDCKRYFSVRTGTPMECSPLPIRKWVYAIYLDVTSLKGVSSMKLHRDLGVTQKTAWFLQQRIREALSSEGHTFTGPVEVDEAYFGGKRKNMSAKKRKALTGRGTVGKTAVAGIKDRPTNQVQAKVVANTKSETMSRFIMEHAQGPDTKVYTDDALTYHVLPNHETVKHGVGEYVRGKAHTNGVESFWSMLKRAYTGTFHKLSPKHLDRYVTEFCGRHNIRDLDTLRQMEHVVARMVGKRLMYRDLTADNGLSSGARG